MCDSLNLSGWQQSVFRKIPAIILLGLTPYFLSAQLKNLSTLPAYDCSLRNVMSMLSKPTIIVSAGNESHLEKMIEDYCESFGSNCIRKKEGDLTKADFEKNIFLVGIVSDFKKWPAYKFPVKQVGHGFTINGKRFTDAGDGFVYADSTRLVIGGNSLQAIKDAQLALTGGHSILVIHERKITWFGNQRNYGFDWYNLQDLKS